MTSIMPLSGAAATTHAEFDSGFPIPTHSDIGLFGGHLALLEVDVEHCVSFLRWP